jgi:hypothetical protein
VIRRYRLGTIAIRRFASSDETAGLLFADSVTSVAAEQRFPNSLLLG